MQLLKARPDDETTFMPSAPDAFQRGANNVQGWLAPRGEADAEFPAEPGRYHVFLNFGCGWCHQLLQVLTLRGLLAVDAAGRTTSPVGVTHVCCYRSGPRGTPEYQGYAIAPGADTSGLGLTCMRDVYNVGTPGGNAYGTAQLTVPVLFDKRTKRVVSNDPAQIHLMLDFLADELGGHSRGGTLYPPELREEIERVNAVVFPGINNGVYCCWFGGKPGAPAFDEGFGLVQAALQWLEDRLESNAAASRGPYLLGTARPTLADVRAFPHLFRFDGIYHELMLRGQGARIFAAFPRLAAWVRDHMFALPEVRASCDLQVATRFYFSSLPVSESDGIYDRRREATGGWLPTREEWAAKRAEEGMSPEQIAVPHLALPC